MPKAKIEPPTNPARRGKGTPPDIPSTNLEKLSSGQNVPLNFAVPAEFKKEFKIFAAEHDITMVELLMRSFVFYKETKK